MKKIALLIIYFTFTWPVMASNESKEVPVQHIKIADVTSMKDAKTIFIEKTSEIKSKKKLDQQELQQIHMITYSLEKSVAYFVENLKGERQALAEEIAIVVEDIHLTSENNRQIKAKMHLNNYFNLAEKFISGF